MNWQQVALAQVPRAPWRNGGGSTRELLAWPSAADWSVRVSIADIEAAGPFSSFPGITRWFAVLEGEGVRLRMADAEHVLSVHSAPLHFDGGVRVECELLAGPTRDFNLMAPPGRATLRRLRGDTEMSAVAGSLVAVYSHESAVKIIDGAATRTVPAATLAWCVAETPHSLRIEARDALWMEVLP